ncbi:RecQ family ATP-dependent DNA helicase [Aquibacillus sediminis]|uniref:RecQ family ATP-dependent DNA helicase n=1 Tax=Aquibacillus sediminis TaxID=2574734 RepID=UPI001FE69744|nr:ATP-dependent DNA helicase RecQ [Aquibacillus sediminis]
MNQLETLLEKHFSLSTFRKGQKEIIQDLLAGNDVLGVLPTGSGKSLCYQLPAKLLDGVVIVVSPLISLMIDQVKQLRANGFKEVVALNSFLDRSMKKKVLNNLQQYKLIYLSPEMLQNKFLIERLSRLHVSLFVVDEAHCISQWGHEFRPDYLKLASTIELLGHPTILALSATATPDVQQDIVKHLHAKKMIKHIYPMDRDNIAFAVEQFDHIDDKLNYLVDLLKNYPVPTMIYFSSRVWTEKAAEVLTSKLPHQRTAFYHGGMEQQDRILIQQQFMADQLDIVCCTSAFGMGIDKANIRLVVHFHLPTQLESFIQELGRAGRDGKSSVSLVLLAPNDDVLPKMLIDSELPDPSVIKPIIHHLQNQGQTVDNQVEVIMEHFNVNETQWRFLRYQLEKQGMIVDNQVITNVEKIEEVMKMIIDLIRRRKNYKQEKLDELLEWSVNKQCRRKGLFSSFQTTVGQPKYACCDVCDFRFTDWEPPIERKSEFSSLNWEEQLKQVMMQGD